MRQHLPSFRETTNAFLFYSALLLLPVQSLGSVIDAPHNETNNIACGACHSFSLWWQHSPTSDTGVTANTICESCHGEGGAYILEKTHSSSALGSMHNSTLADWSRNCIDCHNPHVQEQIQWASQDQQLASQLFLVSATTGAQPGFSINGNTTTFEYRNASALDSWEDAALWTAKSQAGRGLLITIPKTGASNTYEVVAVSADTAIDSASGQKGSGTITVQGIVDQQLTDTDFGMVYGQLIKNEINGASGPTPVQFFNPFGGFVDTAGSPPETPHTAICQVCHTLTNHFLASDTNPAADHLNIVDSRGMSGPAARCTECHMHVNAFGHGGDGGGTQCTQCHQSGNHSEHLSGGVTCGDCHDLDSMRDANGQVILDPLTVSSCDACHNDGRGNGPLVIDYRTGWTDSAYSLDCSGCHQQQPVTGSHTLHLTTAKKIDITCGHCHDNAQEGSTAPEQHVDGTIDVYDQTAGDFGYPPDKDMGSPYGSCSTAYCHSGGKDNFAPISWQDQPAGLDCNSCHGISTQSGYPNYANSGAGTEMANAHATHSEASNCFYCHYSTTKDGSTILEGGTHINKNFDIMVHPVFNGACSNTAQDNEWDCQQAGATWTPFTFSYDAAAKTCSNTICHDNSVQWGDDPANITANCGACHATPPLDEAGSGQPHTIHFGIGTAGSMPQVYGEKHIGATETHYGFYCGFCHPSAPQAHQNDPSAGTAADPKKMEIWLGSRDNNSDTITGGGPLARGATPIYDTALATLSADPGVAKDTQGTPMFYYGFNNGVCLNLYCHSDGQGGAPNHQPVWQLGHAPADCTYCHGNDATAAILISSGSHQAHVETALLNCVNCHSATVSDNRTIKDKRYHVSNYFDTASGDPINPGIAAVDVIANTGISFTYTKETGQCTNISCHGNTDATWGDAATVSCQACHLGLADLDDYVYDNQVRALVEETAWQTSGHGAISAYAGSGNSGAALPACSYCHDNTVGHGSADNPFRLANIQGGNDSNGICMVCHGTASTGFDPDGADSLATVNSTVKVGDTHFGYKHGASNNAGQFCWDCHDPHGDGNIFMIHDKVTTLSDGGYGTPVTTSTVFFTTNNTGTDYARSQAPYDGICNVCHTQTNHYTATSGDGHNSTLSCTACHSHQGYDQNTATAHDNRVATGLSIDCTGCHSVLTDGVLDQVKVDTLHRSDCSLCHSYGGTKLNAVTVASVIQQGIANGGGSPQNCQACHQGEAMTLHHQSAAFAAGNCTSCHTADTEILHDMRSVGTLNCGSCHGATSAAEIDSLHPGCTSCHNYQGTFLDVGDIEAAISSGLAGIPVDCSGCHTEHDPTSVHDNRGISGLSADCTICHLILTSGVVDQSKIDALHGHDCMLCHNYSGSLLDHATVASTIDAGRSTGGNIEQNCQACHTGEVGGFHHLTAVYAAGSCSTCHFSGSHQTHILPTAEGGLVGVGCEECHDMGALPLFRDGQDLTNTTACDNCHSVNGAPLAKQYWPSPGSSIFAEGSWAAVQGEASFCGSCHDDTPANSKGDGSGSNAFNALGDNQTYGFYITGHGRPLLTGAYEKLSWQASSATGNPAANRSCSDCHDLSSRHFQAVNKRLKSGFENDQNNSNCNQCHTPGQEAVADPQFYTDSTDYENSSHGGKLCTECHEVHGATGAANPAMTLAKQESLCLNCHMPGGHPGVGSATFSLDGQSYTLECVSCHNVHVISGAFAEAGSNTTPVSKITDITNPWGDETDEKMASFAGSGTYRTPNGENSFPGDQLPDYASFCLTCHGEPGSAPFNINWDADPHGRQSANAPNGYGTCPNWYTCGKAEGWDGDDCVAEDKNECWPVLPRGRGDQIFSRSPFTHEERVAGANFTLSCTDCHSGHGDNTLIRASVNNGAGSQVWNTMCNNCHYYYSDWHAGMSCGTASCHVSNSIHRMGANTGSSTTRTFDQSLVFHYAFNGTLKDSGTWQMDSQWFSGAAGSFGTGKSGQGIVLNGDQLIQVGTENEFWSTDAGRHGTHIYTEMKFNTTMEAWVNPTDDSNSEYSIFTKHVGYNDGGYALTLQKIGGTLRAAFNAQIDDNGVAEDGRAGIRGAYSSVAIPINTWTHVAATFDSMGPDRDPNDPAIGRIRIYVNGEDVTTSDASGNLMQPEANETSIFSYPENSLWNEEICYEGHWCTAEFSIGGFTWQNGFIGSIDEAKLYNITKDAAYFSAFDSQTAPYISSVEGGIGSDSLQVTFSEGVYTDIEATGGLQPSDFVYTDSDDSRTIIAVSHVGGEPFAALTLSQALDSIDDLGIDTVAAGPSTIFDEHGNGAGTDSVGITPSSLCPTGTVNILLNESPGTTHIMDDQQRLFGEVIGTGSTLTGSAFAGDGLTTYIDFANNPTCLQASTAMTLEARIKPTGLEGTGNAIQRVLARDSGGNYQLSVWRNNTWTGYSAPADTASIALWVSPEDTHGGNTWKVVLTDYDACPIVSDHWYQIRAVWNTDLAGGSPDQFFVPAVIYIDDQGTDGLETNENWSGTMDCTKSSQSYNTDAQKFYTSDRIKISEGSFTIGANRNIPTNNVFNGLIDWIVWKDSVE